MKHGFRKLLRNKWTLNGVSLVFVTVVLCVVIFYVNFKYYAGVIGMGFFAPLLCVALFRGTQGIVKAEKRRRIVFVNSGLIGLIIVMFVIALPRYTYKDSQEMVLSYHLNDSNGDVTMPSLEHKTVPTTRQYSWLLNGRLYYVGIKEDQLDQILYYVVHPIRGQVTKLERPYW
ncbi:hypothetical protein BEP19_09065 [Ammoniphilus oxalaticus]|uniref:Uncharacterized protein n=1 Tax=Ammoniphilus oxalaticus TaxID=66863 RepID=A0A419SKH7_9BACL|nr:hypothetical protein [Ammoniphilus oxalaticus]RKD24523.1 hypothetical protein BEP19_09065 [Ammoniphilus oxalaticus]